MQRTKGFTLIELLVVIAIIALLSSVALATLTSVRVKARDSKRVEEARQIVHAMSLFASEAGSGLPPQATANYSNASSSSPYCGSNNTACWTDLYAQLSPYFPRMPKDSANSYPYVYYYRPLGYNSCNADKLPVVVFITESNEYPSLNNFSFNTGTATVTAYCLIVP
ncbi:MAG TPA: type II secretion system protein [Candidatus Paceibacterota bacterium]|nr:type II secretion system protein [Candidatus Paceibacterota bacterium]